MLCELAPNSLSLSLLKLRLSLIQKQGSYCRHHLGSNEVLVKVSINLTFGLTHMIFNCVSRAGSLAFQTKVHMVKLVTRGKNTCCPHRSDNPKHCLTPCSVERSCEQGN